jgi:hypothetical protein
MKKMICTSLILGVGLVLAAPAAGAQEQKMTAPAPNTAIPVGQQATSEQLDQLFEAMHLREQLESTVNMMSDAVQKQIQAQEKDLQEKQGTGKKLTPEQQAKQDQVMQSFMQKAFQIYPVEEMIGDMKTVYQHHFTSDDVYGILAFYRSPAGQHLLEQQPSIMKEYMPMVMGRIQERSKKLNDDLVKQMSALEEEKKNEK